MYHCYLDDPFFPFIWEILFLKFIIDFDYMTQIFYSVFMPWYSILYNIHFVGEASAKLFIWYLYFSFLSSFWLRFLQYFFLFFDINKIKFIDLSIIQSIAILLILNFGVLFVCLFILESIHLLS